MYNYSKGEAGPAIFRIPMGAVEGDPETSQCLD